MDFLGVRRGLAAAAAAIDGLSALPFMPDSVSPPTFFVGEMDLEFDKAFGRGLDELVATCRLLTSRASDDGGQAELDRYLAGSGPYSVKEALEADPSLGGVCDAVHVRRATGYGLFEFGVGNDMSRYYGIEFFVHVYGTGG
ncbi:hypothetical protein [Saccharothrix lopnurensis]|uniref:Uncharacterized protein n=1 Tax=Saccharothrix lopnurensis TaxID=1670621 RepID=A0ABW1PID5_9PSEU